MIITSWWCRVYPIIIQNQNQKQKQNQNLKKSLNLFSILQIIQILMFNFLKHFFGIAELFFKVKTMVYVHFIKGRLQQLVSREPRVKMAMPDLQRYP